MCYVLAVLTIETMQSLAVISAKSSIIIVCASGNHVNKWISICVIIPLVFLLASLNRLKDLKNYTSSLHSLPYCFSPLHLFYLFLLFGVCFVFASFRDEVVSTSFNQFHFVPYKYFLLFIFPRRNRSRLRN